MALNAVILNCTLKKSPEVSNTEALIRKVVDLMTPLGVESDARYLAHNVVFFAGLLREHPIPTNLRLQIDEAAAVSGDSCPVRHGS